MITLLRPGGVKSVAAENLILRQQLIVKGRTRKRSPRLTQTRCESFGPAFRHLRSHWVMLAVDINTRSIVGFAAHAGDVKAIIACRLLNQILGGRSPPARTSTDQDPIFKHHRWQATLRVLDIDEVKTVPYTPLSHPFVERTIGTVRREFLDQTLTILERGRLSQEAGPIKNLLQLISWPSIFGR
jgi:transposase InsO family protein